MRRVWTLSLLLACVSAVPLAALQTGPVTLPELFRKAKEQVKLGSYEPALSTLLEIDKVSQQPGLEKDREALTHRPGFLQGRLLRGAGPDRPGAGGIHDLSCGVAQHGPGPGGVSQESGLGFRGGEESLRGADGRLRGGGDDGGLQSLQDAARRLPRARSARIGPMARSGSCCLPRRPTSIGTSPTRPRVPSSSRSSGRSGIPSPRRRRTSFDRSSKSVRRSRTNTSAWARNRAASPTAEWFS